MFECFSLHVQVCTVCGSTSRGHRGALDLLELESEMPVGAGGLASALLCPAIAIPHFESSECRTEWVLVNVLTEPGI